MKLQAISAARIGVANTRNIRAEKSEQIKAPYTVSFRGNPKHVIFYGAEYPDYDKKGGVANVMGYYDRFPEIEKTIVQPYYRARKDYTKAGKYTGEITPHQLGNDCQYPGLKGAYFYSKLNFDEKNINKETTTNLGYNLVKKNLIIIKEIASKDVVYGDQPEQTIRAFRAMKATPIYDEKDKEKIIDFKIEELTEPIKNEKGEVVGQKVKNHFFILSKGTGEFSKPYDDGSYSSDRSVNPNAFSKFKPKPYAENNRAFVELKDAICEATKTSDGTKFDPATVVCSDSQTAYTIAFMRDRAVNNDPSYNPEDITPSYVIHNLRKGYTGECGGLEMALNLGLDKKYIDILKKDPTFIEAEEKGETGKYFAKYMPEVTDFSGAFNPTKIAFDLRKKDYVTGLNTVSKGYCDDLANNESIPTALRGEWKELVDAGKAVGIMNPFEDPGFHIFQGVSIPGYTANGIAEIKTKLATLGESYVALGDGLQAFAKVDKNKFPKDEAGKYTVTDEALEHLEEVKNINKGIFLSRLTDKFDSLINVNKDLYNTIVAGKENWNVNLIGRIDKELLAPDKINDIKVYASWGRLDSQKSLDIVMNAFDKFCQANPEEAKKSVLVLGGEAPGTPYSEKVLAQAEIMANKYPGHFSFMEAFAPNSILASVSEQVLLPSREAPCELTDVETMQFLTMLTATRAQGMDDKNFDPLDNAEKATSFKTPNAYFLNEEQIAAFKDSGIGEEWKKEYQRFKDKVQAEMNNRVASAFVTKEKDDPITLDQYINVHEEHKEKLAELLEKYRSLILTTGVVACIERGLKTDKEMKKTMFKNQLNLKTSWENNQELTKTGKSSADMYRNIFNNTARGTENYNTSYLDGLKKHLDDVARTFGGDNPGPKPPVPPKPILKYVAYTAAAVAVIGGATYLLTHKGTDNNNKPEFARK